LSSKRQPVALDDYGTNTTLSSFSGIERFSDLMRNLRTRCVHRPCSKIRIIAVYGGNFLIRGRRQETLARAVERRRWLWIGNDLHAHPSVSVIHQQSFRMLTVERVNNLAVRPFCLDADQAPAAHQFVGN